MLLSARFVFIAIHLDGTGVLIGSVDQSSVKGMSLA
jgi:hypothetical protein